MALPPVFIEFIGSYAGLKVAADGVKRELASVKEDSSLSQFASISSTALLGIGAALAGVGYESVKLAVGFQQTMTRISTQAGVPKANLAELGNDVLNLAGQVGFSPDSLAEALYHVESSFASFGIKAPQAMNLVKIAAEGAAVGGSDLVETQNALDAAVASGIPGAQNFAEAMGNINAAVGSGDMQMQDYVDALSQGLLAVVKGYGLTLTDVNAGLATFGDNNIRGANAATDLRMAVQALAVPAKGGADMLAKLGLQEDSLAKDMQKGGLNAAVTDLENRLNKAGIKGNEVGAVMTTLFGKKAGSGLDVLMGQYDRLESKYPELEKSAKGFNSAVDQQNATITQRVNQLEASLEAIGIKIGNAILPYVTQFLGEVSKGLSWLEQHGSVFKMLAVGLGALTAAMIVAKIATIEWTATLLANPVVLITMAIVGLAMGVYYAYNHFAKFREIVNDVGRFLKNVLGVAIDYIRAHLPEIESALKRVGSVLEGAWKVAWHAAEAVVRWFGSVVIPWFRGRLADLAAWWKSHGHEVEMVVKGLWVTLETIFKVGMNMIRLIYGPWVLLIIHLWKFLWDVLKGTLITAWDLIKNIVEMAWHSLLNIFGLFFDILTGKWGKAWQDAKKLVTQGFADITRVFSGFQHDAIRFLEQAGKDLIQGLINGVKSMVGNAVGAVKGIGSSIVSGFKSLLGIHSPSRVMYEHGMNVVQGLVNALHDGRSMAGSAAERLGQAIMGNIGLSSAATVRLGGLTVDAPSLGTVGGLPGGVVQNIVQLEVQGHVLTDQDLRDLIHQELLRLDGRNGGSYLTAKI